MPEIGNCVTSEKNIPLISGNMHAYDTHFTRLPGPESLTFPSELINQCGVVPASV